MNAHTTEEIEVLPNESGSPLPAQGSASNLHAAFPGMALLTSYARFVRAGLTHQRQTGAILPSQRFLTTAMVEPIDREYDGEIIELGAGTGALTRRLAAHCPDARIVSCEINPALAAETRALLQREELEARVELFEGAAETLLRRWDQRHQTKPTYIVSGIPLGALPGTLVCKLLDIIRKAIADAGCFIQFQYSLLDRRRIQDRFSEVRTIPVPINIPPAVVYIARP